MILGRAKLLVEILTDARFSFPKESFNHQRHRFRQILSLEKLPNERRYGIPAHEIELQTDQTKKRRQKKHPSSKKLQLAIWANSAVKRISSATNMKNNTKSENARSD